MVRHPGIIATQQGVDVKNAPDYKQSLNSDWPLLEIALEKIYTSDLSGGTRFVIAEHNLGFAPAFTWMDSQGFDVFAGGYSANDAGGNFYNIESDTKSVYVTISTAVNFTVRGKLFVYNYDPTKEFTAPSEGSSDTPTSKGSVGMIALKEGSLGNIDDTEYSKFSTHTKTKSLQIHKSGVMSVDETVTRFGVIEHNLGYLPSYMIFSIQASGALRAGISARTFGDGKQLKFSGVQSVLIGRWAYIVFKDPLLEQV